MNNVLHIVTPVSRPELIAKIAKSIKDQYYPTPNLRIEWHLVFDAALTGDQKNYIFSQLMFIDFANILHSDTAKAFVGHAHRNFFLNHLRKEVYGSNHWIYFLDDDTILHPDFISTVTDILPQMDLTHGCIIFNQDFNESRPRLVADKNNVRVGHIDMGMYMFRFMPDDMVMFDPADYCADGIYAEHLFQLHGSSGFHRLNKTLSYYNYLRPE